MPPFPFPGAAPPEFPALADAAVTAAAAPFFTCLLATPARPPARNAPVFPGLPGLPVPPFLPGLPALPPEPLEARRRDLLQKLHELIAELRCLRFSNEEIITAVEEELKQ